MEVVRAAVMKTPGPKSSIGRENREGAGHSSEFMSIHPRVTQNQRKIKNVANDDFWFTHHEIFADTNHVVPDHDLKKS